MFLAVQVHRQAAGGYRPTAFPTGNGNSRKSACRPLKELDFFAKSARNLTHNGEIGCIVT